MDSSLEQSHTLMMMMIIENHTAPARSSKETRDLYRVFGLLERLQQKHDLLHPKYNPQRSGCGDLQTELQLPSTALPHEEVLLFHPFCPCLLLLPCGHIVGPFLFTICSSNHQRAAAAKSSWCGDSYSPPPLAGEPPYESGSRRRRRIARQ
jgi:hypothetical protein